MGVLTRIFRGASDAQLVERNVKAARRYRAESAMAVMHEGARSSPDRTPINTVLDDPWMTGTPEIRRELMAIARWLYINDGFTKGAINKIARYSFPLKPQADTGDNRLNDAYEEYFNKVWSPQADAWGLNSFSDLQRMWSKAVDVDGDIGIQFRRDRNGILRLASIEGHLIGPLFGGERTDWNDGVKVDQDGVPMAYKFVSATPRWPYFAYTRGKEIVVPASEFILLTDANRVRQYRGVSALESATEHIRDKRDILGFEKLGVKTFSSLLAVLKNEGEEQDDPWHDGDNDGGGSEPTIPNRAAMIGGQIPVLAKGQELEAIINNRPSPTFQGFLEFLLREVAEGLGVPLEFVWRADGTGPAQRAVLAQAQRRFTERQDRFIERALNRIWAVVIADAIAQGFVPYSTSFTRVEWQRPPEITIDGGREAMQDREDVHAGLMTRAEHYGRRGRDWYTEAQQLEREAEDLLERSKRLSEKYGITIEAALQLLSMKTPNGNMPTAPNGDQGGKQEKPTPKGQKQ